MLEEITHEGPFSHKVLNEELEQFNTMAVRVERWGGGAAWTPTPFRCVNGNMRAH